jgi:hypothetical protein
MQATLIVERIERHLAVDPVSDAEWLRTRTDTAEGRLRILESMRYTDADVRKYGEAQLRTWIGDDHRRYEEFQRGNWWFVDAQVVAIIGVQLGEGRFGQVRFGSTLIGGIESDATRGYLDEMTDILVTEVKGELAARGFTGLDDLETPYVLSESWVTDTI